MWIFVLFTKKIRQLQAACLRINLPNGTSFGRNLLETCCISSFLDFYSLEPKMKKWKVDSWYLWDIFLVEFLYKLHLVILIGFHLLWFSQRFVHLFFIYFNFKLSCWSLSILIVLCFPFELFVVKYVPLTFYFYGNLQIWCWDGTQPALVCCGVISFIWHIAQCVLRSVFCPCIQNYIFREEGVDTEAYFVGNHGFKITNIRKNVCSAHKNKLGQIYVK